ncbi:hypothetical protein CWC02_04535 [Pseudoalteromonas sp. S2721]|uniref:hypothetical protein n=1 Tax=Pseudoalteromonas sp. S2721 TaxID=579526 RepID=UPI00110BF66E|nr:hypothetical protein [Pseudoalteromonas sp. S2721]TMP20798.1 hypothetical protein CWC02_04535 [Pseudoalteromonas sp. S2721]
MVKKKTKNKNKNNKLAALAVIVSILLSVTLFFKEIKQIYSDYSTEEFSEPLLISLKIKDSITGKEIPRLKEGISNLLEIKVSYKGAKKFVFERIDIKHIQGACASMPSGSFKSDAKYKLIYEFNKESTHSLQPEIILNPADRSVIKFDLELVGKGRFPAACGRVFAKVKYIDESGNIGYLPLVPLSEVRNGIVKIPMFGLKEEERIKYEEFQVNNSGAIKGKAKPPSH